MDHIRPLIIKFIYTAAIIVITLTYILVPAVGLGSSLFIALLVTLFLYFSGDRYLLPRFGPLPTAAVSFMIAALIIAVANGFVQTRVTAGAVLASALVIGVAEWFYYRYAHDEVSPSVYRGDITILPEFLGEEGPGEDNEPHESGLVQQQEDGGGTKQDGRNGEKD